MKKFIGLMFALVFLSACDSGKIFQRFEDIDNYRWSRDKAVSFDVSVKDASASYDVFLAIRHTSYYAFANLMVNMIAVYPSGEERTKDYDFFLKETDGSFKGEGAGDLWDIEFPLMEKVSFPEAGNYTFTISNIMPMPETDDIMQVGLIVKKSK